MTRPPEHICADVAHARRGPVKNAFRYRVDYVLIDPEDTSGPALFSRNRWNLLSVHDRHHGGTRGAGRGVVWAQEVFANAGIKAQRILLLTQPRFLGYVFNPISLWMAISGERLIAVIAEVNNTFGDRHSYICAKPDLSPISPQDVLKAQKLMHVSPFQDIAGAYAFQFAFQPEKIAFTIRHHHGAEGLVARFSGPRKPLSNASAIRALIRRPFGPARTVALIYWQALRLKFLGARYRTRPLPPKQEVS